LFRTLDDQSPPTTTPWPLPVIQLPWMSEPPRSEDSTPVPVFRSMWQPATSAPPCST